MRAKQAQAWQKLQLVQLRRAVYTLAAFDSPQSTALDRLIYKLTGRDMGKGYSLTIPKSVGPDPFGSGLSGLGMGGREALPVAALQATAVMTEFKRTSIARLGEGPVLELA